MNLDPVVNFFKSAKAIYGFIALLIPVAGWAIDLKFVSEEELASNNAKQIIREIRELEVRKGFADSAKEIRMYDTLIKVKENQIREIQEGK